MIANHQLSYIDEADNFLELSSFGPGVQNSPLIFYNFASCGAVFLLKLSTFHH